MAPVAVEWILLGKVCLVKCDLAQEEECPGAQSDRIGTKKSFISRVEKGRADIQLSTLVKLFNGLGRQISVRVI